MLTNIYIERIMNKVKGFQGVYPSDHIPLLSENNSSVIVNFDKYKEPGSHFIAIFRKNKNKVLYFDSLKMGIVPADIANYLNQYIHVFDFSKQIQLDNSTYCGFYCILFIFCMLISEKYWIKICSKFKFGSELNDNMCIKLICKTVQQFRDKIKK